MADTSATSRTRDALPGGLADATARLVEEFAGLHSSEQVVRCVARCHERLEQDAAADGRPARVETMARSMLYHPALLHRSPRG